MHLQNAFKESHPVQSYPSRLSAGFVSWSAAAQGPCRPGDILRPHPQAHTTRHRTPDRIYFQLLQHQKCPNTHCDAGDVLLALIARHLHRWFVSRCAVDRYLCNGMCGLLLVAGLKRG